MKKRNVYLVQPTYLNDRSVYLPYAIGSLAAYAWQFEDIAQAYSLEKLFFLREPTEKLLDQLKEPFLIGFSCYMWNIEYNKLLARKVKERFPRCVVVFGGPQIPTDASLLEDYPFVDILIHYEGEEAFCALLRALLNGTPLSSISNLSFRSEEGLRTTSFSHLCRLELPSPYLNGCFDRILQEHPELEFVVLLETNRGCPHRCAYCSWGSIKDKVRLFPMERVLEEIRWVSRHRMEFLGFADANFGLFPRDEEIVDFIIEMHQTYGYPRKFQVSYAKNSGERVFRIADKLNRCGMDKGVTLSVQTMSPAAQVNIGRSNMEIEEYKRLLSIYAKAKIPTYTELILGLPGETLEGWESGIEELLEYGQHTSLFVRLCEWLPLAEMAEPDYMNRHGVRYSVIPLNQPHASRQADEEVAELSRIVTQTNTMTRADWKQMALFSDCVLCFHHLGLLQMVALYLYFEKGVRYVDFYRALLHRLLSDENSVFSEISRRLDDLINRNKAAVVFDDRFGNLAWPFEEYAFLDIMTRLPAFYREITPFLQTFFPNRALLQELLTYQAFLVKSICVSHREFRGNYQWNSYFQSIFSNAYVPLKKAPVHYTIDTAEVLKSWPEYAKQIVWFGRRGGRSLYSAEVMERKDYEQ